MGGTLDLSTFYMPLRSLQPCTFNMALSLRTTARIDAWERGRVRVASKGFKSAEFPSGQAPFDHPLGFMFAVANYFDADGIAITIESSSPPRSALGGSSAAAVALVAAFQEAVSRSGGKPVNRKKAVLLAHALESSVAGVPCGLQDHLAAAYGGVNAWYWPVGMASPAFRRAPVVKPGRFKELARHTLVAYCGEPHASADINGEWVRQFIAGSQRERWARVAECTHSFVGALADMDIEAAAASMNREVELRLAMTPGVLDAVGRRLVEEAVAAGCGARFTGAGGGGCVWALGGAEDIDSLRQMWETVLSVRTDARLLDSAIDRKGLGIHA
jgi:D-glycero-alpha-D-manno-heptose-7-phosphate kinase